MKDLFSCPKRVPTRGTTVFLVLLAVLPMGQAAILDGASTGLDWAVPERITPEDASDPGYNGIPHHAFTYFGSSMATDDDLLIVGTAPDAADPRDAAYIFRQEHDGTWDQVTELGPLDPNRAHGFGFSVAIDATAGLAVVGDPGYNKTGEDTADRADGAVHIFRRVNETHWSREARLLAPVTKDQTYGPYFGKSVAVQQDSVVVAAPHEDPPEVGEDGGAVYVYEQRADGRWRLSERLLSPERQDLAHFGGTIDGVQLIGDTLVVGAAAERTPRGDGSGVGAVYVFERAGEAWRPQARLVAPDPGGWDAPGGDCFGFTVAATLDVIAVGDPCWDSPADEGVPTSLVTNTGKVYVFERQSGSWALAQMISASAPLSGADFGFSLDVDDDVLAVGAPSFGSLLRTGRAYAYERIAGLWIPAGEIQSNDTGPEDQFGWSIGVADEFLLVGAPFDDNRLDGSPAPVADWGDLPPGPVDGCVAEAFVSELPDCGIGKAAGSVYSFQPLDPGTSSELG